ncbi:MAG: ferredoxin [Pirellulaceae bacterium]|nr:ferredoxin [Pirellulaceae bacterium]
MKSLVTFAMSLAVIAAATCEVQAGCGLLRRGGCSDPCGASACGGVAACGGDCGGGCGQSSVGYASPMGSGCSDCGQNAAFGAGAGPAMAASAAPQGGLIDCGPVASYQVVMEPQYVTETRAQSATEYQDEVRTRTRSIARQVPVEVQDYRTTTVMIPTTETKTVEYSVLVPVKGEKSVEVTESVPVWTDVVSNYTVRVPTLVDVPEEYTVRVAQLRDETFDYTVYVPQTQTQTRVQTVTNAVPVTKQRTIEVCRPVTRMQAVTKDYGHWEVRVEEVAGVATAGIGYAPAQSICIGAGNGGLNMGGCGGYIGACGACGGAGQVYGTTGNGCRVSSTCGGCGGCGSSNCGGCGSPPESMAAGSGGPAFAPAVQTVSRRVWVPNVVTENVPVVENQSKTEVISYTAFETQTEQVPYECTYVVYVPEQRTGTRQAVDYVNETRTRNRKVVQYSEETRSRTHRELSYTTQTRTETIPFVTYSTEKRTKEVTYQINVPQTKTEPFTTTRFDTVVEDVTEEYTVRVPVLTSKEVQVQVCRMVPKLVPVTIYPCSGSAGNSAAWGAGIGGCAACGGTPTLAPAIGSGCASCGQ